MIIFTSSKLIIFTSIPIICLIYILIMIVLFILFSDSRGKIYIVVDNPLLMHFLVSIFRIHINCIEQLRSRLYVYFAIYSIFWCTWNFPYNVSFILIRTVMVIFCVLLFLYLFNWCFFCFISGEIILAKVIIIQCDGVYWWAMMMLIICCRHFYKFCSDYFSFVIFIACTGL